MGFNLNKGGTFSLCPSGNKVARCYMLIDLGTHRETFQGKPVGDVRKLQIGFEFPNETHVFDEKKGPEPYTLSKEYTNSLGEKANLRKDLKNWRGQDTPANYDITKLIRQMAKSITDPEWKGGAPALVNVIHKKRSDGSDVAVIGTIAQLPKEIQCPGPVLKPILYSIDEGPNSETFKALPQWLKDKCAQCLEWANQPKPTNDGTDQEDGSHQPEEEGENPF